MLVAYPSPLISPVEEVTVEVSATNLKPPKNKSKTKSSEWDAKINEITSAVCALFNSLHGGRLRLRLRLHCPVEATDPKTIDDLVRRIEQSVLKFAGVATVCQSFKLQDSPAAEDEHGLVFTVKPALRFCTVEYHLYLPTDFQVSPVTSGDPPSKIAAILERKQGTAVFNKHLDHFRYGERAPDGLREGQTVQFKLLKDDPTSNVTLADRMTNKSNKLTHYVSAFANHEGGNIYFGIDDKTHTVEGQVAHEKEREKIKKKVSNVLSKMIWPEGNSERFWRIEFVPVVDEHDEPRQDTFVIVLTVAHCSGGVFVELPESYHLVHGRVEKISLEFWKQMIKDDASGGTGNSPTDECTTSIQRGAIIPVCISKNVGVIGWSSPKVEGEYMKVAQTMENLRNNGNWSAIDRIAAEILTPENKNADLKLAVTFQCTAAKYRQNKYEDAYDYLQSYHALIALAKNPIIFEVQELYSKSAIKRSERDYQESYRYTYDALQKMEQIVPGWITAWFLCNAASLLTMFASEESEPKEKEHLIRKAECYYRRALEHGQTITEYKKAAANLQHRVHTNLAMLYLASSPNINSVNYKQTISPKFLKSAQQSLNAAEDFEGPPMSGFNEFYFLLAKSDLYLRYFQLNPKNNCEHLKKAVQYANNASKVAADNKFAEVLHCAQSRIDLLENIPCEDQNVTDVVDGLLQNINL